MEYFHPMWFIRLAAGPPNFGLPRLLLTFLWCGVEELLGWFWVLGIGWPRGR